MVDQAKTDLVLIIDEVQHAIPSDDGNQLLLALKAARDAINPRPNTPGYFLFIGTGSHRAQVSEMTAKRNQAFFRCNVGGLSGVGHGIYAITDQFVQESWLEERALIDAS